MMDLESAIKHAEEVAEEYEKICNTKLKVGLPNIYYDKDKSMKCAEEHRQLAEWLKELKRYKKQEFCDDAISRQSMHIELEKWIIYGEYKYSNATKYLYDRIDRLPSVTPQQKMGKWINQHIIYDNATIDFKVCSECRYEFSYDAETGVSDANYCPNCGAKMKGSESKE